MERPSGHKRPALRLRFFILLLLLPGFAGPAGGLTLADIEPLYFDGPSGQGFSASAVAAAGRSAGYSSTASDLWLAAGAAAGQPIHVTQALGAFTNPTNPSASNPVIADSSWTLRNDTSMVLLAPLLVFTSVDPQHVYPVVLPKTGLDGDTLALLRYSFANDTFLYGAIPLPRLDPGATATVLVRYVVAGHLAPGMPPELPPLGVAVLGSYATIPEPATAVLLCAGLIGLASRTRRQRG